MSSRKSVPINTQRRLWADCGGFCQNPNCNKYLFVNIEDEIVSIANMAHIIGVGSKGPRKEHELADYIEENGFNNLIMLCLECHKVIDELEKNFSVESIQQWKRNHSGKIKQIFKIEYFSSERELLIEIDRLLEENQFIFNEYGPFSNLALFGEGGDTQKIWKRRCLDTILPNNEKIIEIIESHKNRFEYPWDIYRRLIEFKVHAISFRENCLFENKINDYKIFPLSFTKLAKKKLGIEINEDYRAEEELEYRYDTVQKFIHQFLSNHHKILTMEEISRAVFAIEHKKGYRLRVFVTNTYFFTEYTYDKVIIEDPNIHAIICSNPYSSYTKEAKQRALNNNIGLFKLKEFMGALNFQGEKFLNFLGSDDRADRINYFVDRLQENELLYNKCNVYLFGSYLRKKIFNDIDLLLVYKNEVTSKEVDSLIEEIKRRLSDIASKLHFQCCSVQEFPRLEINYNNKQRVF